MFIASSFQSHMVLVSSIIKFNHCWSIEVTFVSSHHGNYTILYLIQIYDIVKLRIIQIWRQIKSNFGTAILLKGLPFLSNFSN